MRQIFLHCALLPRPAPPKALMTMESPHPKEPLRTSEVGWMLFVASFVFVGILNLLGISYNIFVRFIFQTTAFSGIFIIFLSSADRMDCGHPFDTDNVYRRLFSFTRQAEWLTRFSEAMWRAHAWMDTWRGLALLWIAFALIGRDDNAPLFTVLHATCGSIIVWLVAFRWTGRESSF